MSLPILHVFRSSLGEAFRISSCVVEEGPILLLFFIHASDLCSLHSFMLFRAETGFGAAQRYRLIAVKTKTNSKPIYKVVRQHQQMGGTL